MSNHNYSNYSKYSNKKTNEQSGEVKMGSATAVEPVVRPVLVEEAVETVELPKTVKGVVVDCMKLNVRANPKTNADVLCVLNVGSEMEIDVAGSTDEWFRVNTAAGVDGYCMRKFVNAKL